MKKSLFSRVRLTVIIIAVIIVLGGFFLIKNNNGAVKNIALTSLSIASKFSNLLPIAEDEKAELNVVNELVSTLTKNDDVERKFLLLLQNNMELRPGGGFLGQYAVIKLKNGEITYSYFEDANILDQRINAKVTPPYPFTRMMQIKKWEFRDSNFSPDFPTNVEKAKYFYRLAGRSSDFDGVIAVNATVLESVLKIIGPITVYGKTFTSSNVVLDLEEIVEKKYIESKEAGMEMDTQDRKAIMKQMTTIILDKLASLGNVTKIAGMIHDETKNKNIMFNFTDSKLQGLIESVYWDGKVSETWKSDYLMMVDANMGSFKSDYYMKREVDYNIDLTQPKPVVNLNIKYIHNAKYGDWRTSDYHSYLRVYVPKGANLLERKMVSYPNIQEEFGKTYFGFIVHTLIGRSTNAFIKYELPEDFNREDYKLLIQKQSGVGDVPVKVTVTTKEGTSTQEQILKKDLRFEFVKK